METSVPHSETTRAVAGRCCRGKRRPNAARTQSSYLEPGLEFISRRLEQLPLAPGALTASRRTSRGIALERFQSQEPTTCEDHNGKCTELNRSRCARVASL